ncbi:MAG: DMT family transporter [Chthonomonadales bacterium]
MGAGAAFTLAAINMLWAASAIAAKAALGSGAPNSHGVGPWTLGVCRFAPAALVFLLYLRITGQLRPMQKEHRRDFLLIGILGLAFTYGIFYGGLRWTSATEGTLLVSAEPVFIALMARAVLHERLTGSQWAGMGIGFAGVYLLVNRGFQPTMSANVLGNIMIAAALCFEAYSGVIGKRLAAYYPGVMVLAIEMLVGSAVMLPWAVWEVCTGRSGLPSAGGAVGMAYLAIVCTMICYGVWFHWLPKFRLSSMAGFLYIQPVMGPVYGRLFLGERLSLWTCIGGIAVVAGVWLVAARDAAG